MTKGWGKIVLRGTAVLTLLAVTLSNTVKAEVSCATTIQDVGDFNWQWRREFFPYPDLTQMKSALTRKVLAAPGLNADVKGYLSTGGDVLAIGNRVLLKDLAALYSRLIDESTLSPEKKDRIRRALYRAVETLSEPLPQLELPVGGGGEVPPEGEGGFSSGLPEPPEIESILNQQSLKKCVVSNAILFTVSNAINTAGALQYKWAEYAEADKGVLENLFSKKMWQKASADWGFRHNCTWNAILMLTLGATKCLKNPTTGKKLLVGLTFLASTSGQYLSTGKISLHQTALDVLFVRYISTWKTGKALQGADWWGARRLPLPAVAETTFQMTSEGVGAWLYPRVLYLNERLFGEGLEPESKK